MVTVNLSVLLSRRPLRRNYEATEIFEHPTQQSTKSHLNQTKNFVQIISDVLFYNGNQHSKLLKYKLKRSKTAQTGLVSNNNLKLYIHLHKFQPPGLSC